MVRFIYCGCGHEHLFRMQRSWWMRLFGARRLYLCTHCKRWQLLARHFPKGAALNHS